MSENKFVSCHRPTTHVDSFLFTVANDLHNSDGRSNSFQCTESLETV